MKEELHPGFTIMPHLDKAYKDGEEIGRLKALLIIRQEIQDVTAPMMVDQEYLDGLKRAAELIEGLEK